MLGFGTLQHKLLSLFDSVQGRFPIREDMYEQIGGMIRCISFNLFFQTFRYPSTPQLDGELVEIISEFEVYFFFFKLSFWKSTILEMMGYECL